MGTDFEVTMNEYLPLRDVVFNTLRQAILRGELKPGADDPEKGRRSCRDHREESKRCAGSALCVRRACSTACM